MIICTCNSCIPTRDSCQEANICKHNHNSCACKCWHNPGCLCKSVLDSLVSSRSLEKMDIRHYFSASTSKQSSTPAFSSSSSENDEPLSSDSQCLKPPPTKRSLCSTSNYRAKSKYSTKSGQRKYSKKWEKEFLWLEYDENYQGAFCKTCQKFSHHPSQKTGGAWITKPFKNWRRAVEKMRAHAKSDTHIRHSEAELLAAKKEGSILEQL